MGDFSLSVAHETDRSVITCSGDLDLLPAEKLRESVDQAMATAPRALVVDCSGVELLTSAGITALVDTAIRCRENGVVLDLRLSPQVRRILDLVGLWWLGVIDDGIAVHGSLQRALRTYADQSFAGALKGEPLEERDDPSESVEGGGRGETL